MLTVAQARNDSAIRNAARLDSADPRIIAAIDRGQRVLMGWGNWADTVQEYQFNAVNGCIFTPPEIQSILFAQVTGQASEVFSQSFFYLPNGPVCPEGADPGVVDRGPVQVLTQPACPSGLLVISDSCEMEPDLWVDIVARDSAGRHITTEKGGVVRPYISIPLTDGKANVYPIDNVMFVDQVTKPLTKSAVHVYAFNNACHTMGNLITSLAPHDMTPSWRKYQVTGCDGNACVRVLAKRRHTPLYHDAQALIVDDIEALAGAISYYIALEGGNLEGAALFRDSTLERLRLREREMRGSEVPRLRFPKGVGTTAFRRLRR